MKKIILILTIAIFFMANLSFSQEKIENITSFTIQSDTSYATATFDDNYSGAVFYDGVVGYQFNVSDTIRKVQLEGRYSPGSWILISSMDTVTAGAYGLYQIYPVYHEYRLGFYGASGGTSVVSGIVYFDKRRNK